MSILIQMITISKRPHSYKGNPFKPMECILRFLDDSDLLALGVTCQTMYRYLSIYVDLCIHP